MTLMNSGDAKTNKKEIRTIINETLQNVCDHMLLLLENTVTLFVLLPEKMDPKQSGVWAVDVAELIAESLYRGNGIRYRIGLGDFYELFGSMPGSYRQSLDAIKGDSIQAGATSTAEHDNSANIHYYVQYAIRYIDTHYQEDISLDMVAAKIGISPFYLSRLIKQIKGIAFVEYLTDVRIRKAKEIALETELPIAEIAFKCGYSNISYFYKVFKKATGETIGEYRKSH